MSNTPTKVHPAAVAALAAIMDALLDAIETGGDQGVPAGTLYAAMMTFGCSLNMFNNLMDALIAEGCISKSNNLCYFIRRRKAAAKCTACYSTCDIDCACQCHPVGGNPQRGFDKVQQRHGLTVEQWEAGMGCSEHKQLRSGSCHDCACLQPAPTEAWTERNRPA